MIIEISNNVNVTTKLSLLINTIEQIKDIKIERIEVFMDLNPKTRQEEVHVAISLEEKGWAVRFVQEAIDKIDTENVTVMIFRLID